MRLCQPLGPMYTVVLPDGPVTWSRTSPMTAAAGLPEYGTWLTMTLQHHVPVRQLSAKVCLPICQQVGATPLTRT